MPDSFIHADIFFFVSTIALILITSALIWALFYIIAILKNVRDITDRAKAEWGEIVMDVKKLRGALRDEGIKLKQIIDLIQSFFINKPKKKISRTK